ncbi:unnamed protein product [Rotaria sp. Silwood1]|nr:unnamed protein product [Rotaria sp. Silwood1]CAF1608315.1 unnamed protein product [Rotaria sp. Silwood1]CAF3692611.1 unnamed protein product [Rotaria sp. Silwood1]
MNENGSSEGVGVVIRHTADLSKMIVAANDTNQKHMEYLPYPDWNFNEESEEFLQKTSSDKNDEQCPLEQIYLRCNKTFLPGQSVQVIKIEAERIHHPVIEFLYPYLYTITIRYGSTFEWTIKKRYKDFYDLHQALRTYVTSELAKSCNNLNSVRPSETIDDHDSSIRRQEKQLPCFPTRNDRIAFINEFSKNERCKILQNYLNKVLKHPKLREHSAMRNFLGVSPLSFVRGLGKSLREAELLKRSNDDYRGRSIFIRLLFSCDIFKFHRNRKWFVIKDSYIVYMKIDSALVGFPMLVDHAFSIDRRFRKTKTTNGIRIKNLQRLMVIKCQSGYERDKWFDTLMEIKNKSLFTQQHLFKSFAPQRQQQYAQWFINGQPYMEALAKAILAAREEIYISDWWLSPEIMLIRPYQDDSMRLDNLLGKRAEEGIRIYILIFKDILSVVGLNSYHTKKQLVSKSPNKKNIKIIRHPNHRVLPGTESSFLYSHHEKTVVIDQRLAFIGGLDLCWGRWDTDDHRLVDLSNENITELKSAEELANQSDQESTKEEAAVDTAKQMAKNNTNQGIMIKSKNSRDDSSDEEQDASVNESSDTKPKTIFGVTSVVDDTYRFFLGKDYSNYYQKDFESIEKFDEDYIDRKLVPRMPWHDEILVVLGEAARDCARHFIQRWNIHKADKHRFNESYPYLLPKTCDDDEIFDTSFLRSILPDDRPPIRVDAQCVRSASFWSCGICTVERSVENAYIHMIENAQHFIYIENQFFVTIPEDAAIKNHIGDALYRRIIRAHSNKERFRIYILLPLLPGFANAKTIQAVLYFIMRSINKGEMSLYQRLKKNGVSNPEDYITFYGMRNWDILMGTLVTEIIYVHSKLMIVDDRMCICGSANINDRSLQGSRDSEICLVVNDVEMIDSYLNGRKEKVGLFCSSWRKKLFRLLLGIKNEEEINVDDPCSDEFYQYFRRIAQQNTKIYEEVFNSLPTNQIRKFTDVEAYEKRSKLKETDPQTAYDKCKKIQGFIVEFPIEYLADDVIMPKWNTSEDEQRLTIPFRFCFNELLRHLPVDSKENIIFIFTNARPTFYAPGNTTILVQTMLKEHKRDHGVEVPFSRNNTFLFDNEPFRYLALRKNGITLDELQTQSYIRSWDHSVKEYCRLMRHLVTRSLKSVSVILSLNEAEQLVRMLPRPIAETSKLIEQNIQLAKDHKKRVLENPKLASQGIPQNIAVVTRLKHPRTVCVGENCCQMIDVNNEKQIEYICICHDECYLKGVKQETLYDEKLQDCTAMDPRSGDCGICGCHWLQHKHITYEHKTKRVVMTLSDIDQRISDLRGEASKIQEVYKKVAIFLHANAIVATNDDILEYLQYFIREEQMKQSVGASNADVIADIDIRQLSVVDANLINDCWADKSEDSLGQIKYQIEHLPTLGAYGDGKLISWRLLQYN